MAVRNARHHYSRPPSFESFHPFLNFPLPHTVVIVPYISTVFTLFDHKIRITDRCCSLVHYLN
jgi:hypothetical protein